MSLKPERVALESRFKYTLEDTLELPALAVRSGLPAVASLHGKPLRSSFCGMDREGAFLTHVVPDFGLLQSGQHLQKQLGYTSGYVYSSAARERVPDVDAVDDDDFSCPRRLNVGQAFFEYRVSGQNMIPAAGVEEMYLFVGLAEEYEHHRPTLPADNGIVKGAALLGLRFRRCRAANNGDDAAAEASPWRMCFLQSTGRSIEHDPAEGVLSAVKLTTSSKIFVVDGSTESIFGRDIVDQFESFISKSVFYQAHREYGLLPKEPTVLHMHGFSRTPVASRPAELRQAAVFSVQAQLLQAIGDIYVQRFESLRRASPAMIAEAERDLTADFANQLSALRKHQCWLLGKMKPAELQTLMRCAMEQVPSLTTSIKAQVMAAFPTVTKRPIDPECDPAPKKSKKAGSLDALLSGGVNGGTETPPAAEKPAGSAGLLPPNHSNGLFGTPTAHDLATELSRQLGAGDLVQLKSQLKTEEERANREKLRADSEKQRADAAEATRDGLRKELSSLRESLDQRAVASSSTPSSVPAQESEHVKTLKNENQSLRLQNNALILLVGDEKKAAAELLSKAAGLVAHA